MKKVLLLALFAFIIILSSCSGLKGYERVYLNDEEMAIELRKIQWLEKSFHTYREGASGASGGKTGGGCGCN
jgi:hypothetical protein